ncbi:DUF3052 domain-containing protein [Neomicrococcus aestuarii]|uniref:DUF3052 domain-containing protein n=1 Tax=Neomicrococcus aestuarii TaxID=556325 RepID=A0A1L2ZKN1_9MICC|nr:DUF3052 domain-containing protein [Neomicrococcus aestuarii]APF39975.1 hypothetical protein BHE16_01875 [Neomicrococcus aestuarii]MBB5512097.1 hypothetical protein [Neomicrococcus aestuarii]
MGDAESAQENVASKLGFKSGDLVQELGYDDDVDFDLRDDVEDIIESELLTEEDHEVADAVILWWRAEDGDLIDGLVDSQTSLDEGGAIWLLTPKPGREGHVPPADILEAAPTSGLHVTKTEGVSREWAATRLVSRRKN